MEGLNELEELREEYLKLAREIASMYGLTSGGKPRVATVMKVLGENECERLIQHLLRNPVSAANGSFDRYYREKHEFYRRKLVDRLKNELEDARFNVLITTEENVETGRYDVTIVSGRRVRILNGQEEIVIEIKGSLGISLEQIERYLLNGTVIILVRVVTGHVARLSTYEYIDFLAESVKDLTRKAERILGNKPVMIRGSRCRECPVETCVYNVGSGSGKDNCFQRIVMKDEEFNLDLDSLLRNTYPTITKVTEMVLEVLKMNNKMADETSAPYTQSGGKMIAAA